MPQITARQLLEHFRINRSTDQEIAMIEFMELSEAERWELLFIGLVSTSHLAEQALKKARE